MRSEALADLEPEPSGATLYLLEAEEDFLEDVSVDIINRHPQDRRVLWIGERALRMVLKAMSCGNPSRQIMWTDHVPLHVGHESHLHLDDPAPCVVGGRVVWLENGDPELRWYGKSAGFHLSAMPGLPEHEECVKLSYSLQEIAAAGTGFHAMPSRPGEFELEDITLGGTIDGGPLEFPKGATLLFEVNRRFGRRRLILVCLGSVEPN